MKMALVIECPQLLWWKAMVETLLYQDSAHTIRNHTYLWAFCFSVLTENHQFL